MYKGLVNLAQHHLGALKEHLRASNCMTARWGDIHIHMQRIPRAWISLFRQHDACNTYIASTNSSTRDAAHLQISFSADRPESETLRPRFVPIAL